MPFEIIQALLDEAGAGAIPINLPPAAIAVDALSGQEGNVGDLPIIDSDGIVRWQSTNTAITLSETVLSLAVLPPNIAYEDELNTFDRINTFRDRVDFETSLLVDVINEFTAAAGVTVETVRLEDGLVFTADGGVGAPALAPASSPTDGIYFPSAGVVNIALGGALIASFATGNSFIDDGLIVGGDIATQAGDLILDQRFIAPVTTLTGTSLTLGNHYAVLVDDDTAGGTVTITLPTAASSTGVIYHIKKLGTTASVIVDGNGAETIDGGTTATLTTQFESITIQSDGTSWSIL